MKTMIKIARFQWVICYSFSSFSFVNVTISCKSSSIRNVFSVRKKLTVFEAEDARILQSKGIAEDSYCTENRSISPRTMVKGTSEYDVLW